MKKSSSRSGGFLDDFSEWMASSQFNPFRKLLLDQSQSDSCRVVFHKNAMTIDI